MGVIKAQFRGFAPCKLGKVGSSKLNSFEQELGCKRNQRQGEMEPVLPYPNPVALILIEAGEQRMQLDCGKSPC